MKFVTAGVIVLLPTFANAEQDDAAYCQALADKYRRYVADNQNTRRLETNISVDVAMTRCASKPADSIPTLEKALKDAMVDLPKR